MRLKQTVIKQQETIRNQLESIGFKSNMRIEFDRVLPMLNVLAMKNSESHFDFSVATQIIEHTKPIEVGQVLATNVYRISDIIRSIAQAMQSLRLQIQEIQKSISHTKLQPKEQDEAHLSLYSLAKIYNDLAKTFLLAQLNESETIIKSKQKIPQELRDAEALFSLSINLDTKGLKVALWLCLLVMGLEIAIMFHKNHFYSLLALCSVSAIYFLNFFDKIYIRFVLVNLMVSVVLDLLWVIVCTRFYWKPKRESLHSTIQEEYLRIIVVMTVLCSTLKLVMAAIFFKYFSIPENQKHSHLIALLWVILLLLFLLKIKLW